MTRRYLAGLLPAALLLVAGAAAAAEPAAAKPYPVELIPTIGVRNGATLDADTVGLPPATADASPSFGLTVDWFVRPDAWFEVFVDHQTLSFTSDPAAFGTSSFDLAIDYLQFGGGYGPATGRVRGYVTAAVGLTRYGASPGDVGSSIGASGSLGGGMKVPVSSRMALRFELRGYATVTDAAVSVTCGPGCFVQFAADGWYQLGLTFGLAIRL